MKILSFSLAPSFMGEIITCHKHRTLHTKRNSFMPRKILMIINFIKLIVQRKSQVKASKQKQENEKNEFLCAKHLQSTQIFATIKRFYLISHCLLVES